MIEYFTPYDTMRNLGAAYNRSMDLLKYGHDYGVLKDADTCFTTPDFGTVIQENLLNNQHVRCWTAMTNRVGSQWQVPDDVDIFTDDYGYHRRYGIRRQEKYRNTITDVTSLSPFSGHLIIFRKDLWDELGGAQDGLLGVDTDLFRRVVAQGDPICMMNGVYLYHWYRGGNRADTSHLVWKP